MADRVQELTAKTRTGSATPAEMEELKGLLSAGANRRPTTYGTGALGVQPLKSEEEMRAELQAAAQKKLADDEIARKRELETLSRQSRPVAQREGYIFNPDTSPQGKKIEEEIRPELTRMASGDFSSWEDTDQQKVAKSMGPEYDHVGDPGNRTGSPSPAPVQAKEAPAVVTTESGAEIPKEEIAAAVAPQTAEGEGEKKQGFGDKLKELAVKYGVPLLEILQAVGYQRAGIDKPTILEQKYQEKVDSRKQELMDKLDAARAKRDEEASGRLLEKQQQFQEMQAVLDRLAEKEALGQKLTSDEKMLQMQLAGARRASSASLIPE